MALAESVKTAIRESLHSAPRAERAGLVKRLASTYGISSATVYRVAALDGPKRKRGAGRPEYVGWTRIAIRLRERAPKPIPLDVAIESGLASGALPPVAADMPVATAYRIAREMGWARRSKRTHRLSADYPMQCVLFDGSTSENLIVGEDLGGGDYLLKLHNNPYPASGYKNKPLSSHRLRLVVYGVWDMCTGYTRANCVAALGENSLDSMENICAMLSETGDPARPLHGVPDDMWADGGALLTARATADLLARLEIAAIRGKPCAKERMGGVERPWRTLWSRFERSLFLRKDPTIRLSELNLRLQVFEARENALRLSRTPVAGRPASRAAAWIALTNARPADNPLRKLPADPVRTLVREARRKVDQSGIVRWGGVEYECADFHDCWVTVRRAIDDSGDLVVIEASTKKTGVATVWTPSPYGEIRTPAKTELEKLRESDEPLPLADPYAERTPVGNVVSMPARSAPAAPLEDPMEAAEKFASPDEARAAFIEQASLAVWGQMSGAARDRVDARILELELDRAAVVELAQQVTVAAYGDSA